MAKKRIKPPCCPYCGKDSQLVTGAGIYPAWSDLADKPFYRCMPCGAWVGCHPGTKKPLGVPANAELRRARQLLHERRLDPIWKSAIVSGGYRPEDRRAMAIITRTARKRVYDWLSYNMDIPEYHTGLMTLEQCREAWMLLSNITYPDIRRWAKERKRDDIAKTMSERRKQQAEETVQ